MYTVATPTTHTRSLAHLDERHRARVERAAHEALDPQKRQDVPHADLQDLDYEVAIWTGRVVDSGQRELLRLAQRRRRRLRVGMGQLRVRRGRGRARVGAIGRRRREERRGGQRRALRRRERRGRTGGERLGRDCSACGEKHGGGLMCLVLGGGEVRANTQTRTPPCNSPTSL